MLGINCLLRNAEILPNLKDIVDEVGNLLASEGQSASIENVYRTLRGSGVEIDIQTLSYLYEEVFDLTDPNFSTADEVAEAREETMRDLLDLEAEDIKVQQIGKDNPVVATVEKIMNAITLVGERSKSLQRIFQDRLMKAARRVSKLKPEASAKMSTEQILREVLMLEQPNDFAGLGMMENAETLFNELKKELSEAKDLFEGKEDVYNLEKLNQYADILEQSTYKFLMSAPEMQQVIRDTLKDAGYVKTVNAKSGEREVVDWNKVLKSNIDFTKTIKDVFSKKGFTEKETDRIAEEMIDEFENVRKTKMANALDIRNKDVKKPEKNNAVKRLHNLYTLGIFNNNNKNALFRLLGVQQVTQQRINTLHNLMGVYNQAGQQPITKWSSSYIRTIQREIEKIIEESEESNDGKVNLVRKWSFFSQLNNALLLSNPQNAIENTTSGIFQYLMTTLTNPKDAKSAAAVTANVWMDVVQGGVREGHELYNTFNSSGNLEDRYNVETAKTPGEKIAAYAAFLPRAILSSVDNSIKAGLVHTMGTGMLRKILIKQGATAQEANILMNEAFYGNKKEIEDVAKKLENNLTAMGVNTAKDKWKRLAAEMAWGNMLTDGDFFNQVLGSLKQQGQVNPTLNPQINEELLNSIRNAAETAAGKGLGHQSDSWLLQYLDTWAQQLSKGVTEARQKKEGLAKAEMMRNVYSNVNRYRPGSLRWWWLSFEKSSGLALLQTLLTDVVFGKKSAYNFSKIDLSDTNQNLERDLDRYMSLRQRLVRETVAPIFAYTVGNVVLAMLLKSFGGDDDDKEGQLINLATWMLEDDSRKRWMQKMLPPRNYNYLTSIAWVDPATRKIKHKKKSEVSTPEEITLRTETENLVQNFKNNYSQTTVANLFNGLKSFSTKPEQAGAAVGEFGGNFLNLGGPLRAYQLYKDALTTNPRMTKSEWDKVKPDNMYEGFMRQTLNRDLYESWVKKVE